MASDSSDSPLVLTPEPTGTMNPSTSTSSPDSGDQIAVKKSRRQTAFYPNMKAGNKPQKPFSRSAAKRESVMALGSIEHLQHYFTKTGLQAKKNQLLEKQHYGLVPAIGVKGHTPLSPSMSGIDELMMPPSPAVPSPPRPLFSSHVKTYDVDPDSLLPVVIEDVIAVAQDWKLDQRQPEADGEELDAPFDVLEVLKTTTRAIRSTRNYLLSLPDESVGTIRAQFRPKTLRPNLPSSSSSSTSLASSTSTPAAAGDASQEPITLIRRAAIEVLTVLRHLEETYRLPLSDDAYDAQSDGAHSSSNAKPGSSPSTSEIPIGEMSFSLVQLPGRPDSVPVWEQEDDGFPIENDDDRQKRDGWDERLVLGSGWLYRKDVRLQQLRKERGVVARYLDVVDEVLFDGGPKPGAKTGERGWERVRRQREGRASSRAKNRRVSAGDGEGNRPGRNLAMLDTGRRVSTSVVDMMMRGMSMSEEPEEMDGIKEEDEDEDEFVEDDELPEWAKRTTFEGDALGRAHALLAYFLPSTLLPHLGPPNNRIALLTSLSSGQLLCVAYNAAVRKSKKPWGFVSKDGIHDIIALEKAAQTSGAGGEEDAASGASGKKVWTFRRTDNLRLWAGALKIRYTLPIETPSHLLAMQPTPGSAFNTPLSSPSGTKTRFAFGPRGKDDREPPILFDPPVVAKREPGWDDMLEAVLTRWVDKAVEERRNVQS